MGTHPIFESDFDCLTENFFQRTFKMVESWLREKMQIKNKIARIMLAEFFGTFILCLVGNGAVHEDKYAGTGALAVCFAYGMGVAFGIYASAGVSGGHINPAVTISFAIMGRLGKTVLDNVKMFFIYSIAQILGAFISSCVVYGVYHDLEGYLIENQELTNHSLTGLYATWPQGDFTISAGALFFDQVVATWILITVIFALLDAKNVNPGGIAPFLIGIAACVIGLSYGANGGGAINPARDLGPRLFSLMKYGSAAMTDNAYFFWIPLFAPLVGGVTGAILYHIFIAAHWEDEEDKGEYEPVDDKPEADNQQLVAEEDC